MIPHERLVEDGACELSDIDLMTILLHNGIADQSVRDLAKLLLTDKHGEIQLKTLKDLKYDTLKSIKGIGKMKAIQLVAIVEIAKRLHVPKPMQLIDLKNPEDVAGLFVEEFENKFQEMFYALYLDSKLGLIKKHCISIGTLNMTIVHARDVFRPAIEVCANSLIVVHNHPSGDPEPSKQDITITRDLQFVGEVIKIPLLDHVIVGDGDFRSLRQMGILENQKNIL
ncbi:RadC family protein [Candidatus Epulonipiscium viviparus]|uniref:RadC family protein n=1 Tax=Candidatus Epulonipiscium viviparus TaxID=420336 RepID=UPI00016C0069|nr:DNA repair protein RadC [Candidatus Epulopiscium viviparus]